MKQYPTRPGSVASATGAMKSMLAAFLLAITLTPCPSLMAAEPASKAGNTATTKDPLAEFLRSLPPSVQQAVSDSMLIYRNSPRIAKSADSKRLVFGKTDAPTRLIEWTDIRCPHCKHLEETLTKIREEAPPGSWSEEARHFPLDAECNPYVQRSDGSGISCLAAKIQICLAGSTDFSRVRATLFNEQTRLSRNRIWEVAASTPAQRKTLEACVKSPQTAATLKEDLDLAVQHKLEGTPLVVINDRKATSVAAMIYTMIMVMGQDNAPGFKVLPPPINAHMH